MMTNAVATITLCRLVKKEIMIILIPMIILTTDY